MTIPPIDLTALKDGLPATEASATTPLNNLQTALNNLLAGDAAWDQLNYGQDTKTIASDAITITKTYNKVDTEAAAATDNLSTINGGNDGDILILVAANAGRVITLKNGIGNVVTSTGADITLSSTRAIMLFKSGSIWSDISLPAPSANPETCQLRMTGVSGTPVAISDATALTSIYITPFRGNKVALYYAGSWQLFDLTEIPVSLVSLSANTLYDFFIYWTGSTISVEAQGWASANARAVAVTMTNGVYTKGTDPTRRYIGTIRTTVAGQTEDSRAKRYIWNYYNRQNRLLYNLDISSHSYTTAAWRTWLAATTMRFEYIVGFQEDTVQTEISARWGGASSEIAIGLALNSTVVPASANNPYVDWLGSTIATFGDGAYENVLLGYNYHQLMEFGGAGVTMYSARISGSIKG